MSQNDIVSIKLLDREYQIKCPPEKTADLEEAANYLDSKMRETSEGGKKLSLDRIFMIAALNITNEFASFKKQKNAYIDNVTRRIQGLQNKIEQKLAGK